MSTWWAAGVSTSRVVTWRSPLLWHLRIRITRWVGWPPGVRSGWPAKSGRSRWRPGDWRDWIVWGWRDVSPRLAARRCASVTPWTKPGWAVTRDGKSCADDGAAKRLRDVACRCGWSFDYRDARAPGAGHSHEESAGAHHP